MKKFALMLSLAIASLSFAQALMADDEPRKGENPNPSPETPASDPAVVHGGP